MALQGIDLSPTQLVSQWRTLPNKFAVNIWNFEIKIGKEAVSVFQESFYLGGFNSAGQAKWKERKRRKKHPILMETGTLRRSIKYKHNEKRGALGTGINVYTDTNAFRTAARNKGFCYAAVHNDPSGTHVYGASGAPSVQRQFMGYSSVLNDALNRLTETIFHGFPK